MSESRELSDLISAVYDAALDTAMWTPALKLTAEFLRSAATVLGSFDAVQANGIFDYSWGYDPAQLAIYVERYAKLNPLIPASVETRTGDVVSAYSLVSEEAFMATPVYREWAKPQRYVDAAQATLERSGTAFSILAAVRHESVGRVDETMLRRMKLLVPHFRRAVLISKIVDLKTVQAAAFAETIDGLAAGVFLVDRGGCVVHANLSGRALSDEGAVVRLRRGILTATDSAADRRLADAIAAAGGSEVELAERALSIPLISPDGQSHIAHVLPLGQGARQQTGLLHAAIAAVFVRKASLDLSAPVDSVARRYALTPTETQVLRAVVEYGGVTPIAANLGMSEATVKTHLQHLFGKTGSSRQVDLVKLAFSFADPLAS